MCRSGTTSIPPTRTPSNSIAVMPVTVTADPIWVPLHPVCKAVGTRVVVLSRSGVIENRQYSIWDVEQGFIGAWDMAADVPSPYWQGVDNLIAVGNEVLFQGHDVLCRVNAYSGALTATPFHAQAAARPLMAQSPGRIWVAGVFNFPYVGGLPTGPTPAGTHVWIWDDGTNWGWTPSGWTYGIDYPSGTPWTDEANHLILVPRTDGLWALDYLSGSSSIISPLTVPDSYATGLAEASQIGNEVFWPRRSLNKIDVLVWNIATQSVSIRDIGLGLYSPACAMTAADGRLVTAEETLGGAPDDVWVGFPDGSGGELGRYNGIFPFVTTAASPSGVPVLIGIDPENY